MRFKCKVVLFTTIEFKAKKAYDCTFFSKMTIDGGSGQCPTILPSPIPPPLWTPLSKNKFDNSNVTAVFHTALRHTVTYTVCVQCSQVIFRDERVTTGSNQI